MLGLIVLLQTLMLAVTGPPTSPEYLPLRVADAEGYFKREGLSVVLKTTRAEVGAAEALAQGQVDLAATSLEAILRFGPRQPRQMSKLVLGLTAAPPVALLTTRSFEGTLTSVKNLVGLRIGVAPPGAPEHAWLNAVLARAGVPLIRVDLVSLGTRGLVVGLETGDVQAGLVAEPNVSRLVNDNGAVVLADLRSPEAVAKTLGAPTVNAGVFGRSDRMPRAAALAAFGRAVLAAERLIADTSAEDLAGRWPASLIGAPDEFSRRLNTTREIFLPNGTVTPSQLTETVDIVRAYGPLPAPLKMPKPEELIPRSALKRRSPRAGGGGRRAGARRGWCKSRRSPPPDHSPSPGSRRRRPCRMALPWRHSRRWLDR